VAVKNQTLHMKYLDQIKSHLSSQKVKDFVEHLYNNASYDDLALMEILHLAKSAEAMYSVLQQRKGNETKVEIYRAGENSDYAVLQIICDDLPFVIDSISNEIKLRSLDIFFIIYPSIMVERSAAGAFKKVSENGNKELVLQLHLANWSDDALDKKLIQRIKLILQCIQYAVKDARGRDLS
jgi:glutamate dehydrogenase